MFSFVSNSNKFNHYSSIQYCRPSTRNGGGAGSSGTVGDSGF